MKIISARKRQGQPVTDEVLAAAIERGEKFAIENPRAIALRISHSDRVIELDFIDGSSLKLKVDRFPEFVELSVSELDQLELGFAGHAICLQAKDLHVSIEGLVRAELR